MAPSLDELIIGRGYRHCYFCGQKVALTERTIDAARARPFTCEDCESLEVEGSARLRYLRHEATKEEGLEQAAARIRGAKAGLDAILDEWSDE